MNVLYQSCQVGRPWMTFTWTFAYIHVINNQSGVPTRLVHHKITTQQSEEVKCFKPVASGGVFNICSFFKNTKPRGSMVMSQQTTPRD